MTEHDLPDDAAQLSLRKALVSRFRELEGEEAWLAEAVLDLKSNYQLGGPLDWTQHEIDIVMLELLPAKTIWDDADYREACPAIARFFRMLGAEGHVSQRQAESHAAYVESIADELVLRAMTPDYWSMGKRIMRHAGGSADLTDEAELNRVMEEFNALPFEERVRITGPMPTEAPMSLPPITLPSTEVLAAAAVDTRLLRWLRLLVDHVGDGLEITPRGNLKRADGKALNEAMDTGRPWEETFGDRTFSVRSTVELLELDMTFRVALATGILERSRRGSRIGPGKRLDLLDDPLEAIEKAWLAMVDSSTWPDRVDWLGHRVERVWSDLVNVMIGLYPDERAVVELAQIKRSTMENQGRPSESLMNDMADWHMRACLEVLGDLGFVTVSGELEYTTEYGLQRKTGGTAMATPLGLWAAQRHFSQYTSAPVVGRLRSLDAAEMLSAMADLGDEEADGELHAWVEEHGDTGLAAIADCTLEGADTVRAQAWWALVHIGPPATAAVSRLAAMPETAARVALWMAAVEGEGLFALNAEGSAVRFVDLMAAATDFFGAEAAVEWAEAAAGAAGVENLLDETWRLDDERVPLVLGALGQVHPKKGIAKAARTALFKHNSR